MGRGARGYVWLRHELRRELARRREGTRRQFWCLVGIGVGAFFAVVVTVLVIASL